VDSGLWRVEPWIGDWAFSEYTRLNLDDSQRGRFATPAFWNFLMGENYFGGGDGRPIQDFYHVGEEGRINVVRFGTGELIVLFTVAINFVSS